MAESGMEGPKHPALSDMTRDTTREQFGVQPQPWAYPRGARSLVKDLSVTTLYLSCENIACVESEPLYRLWYHAQ